MEKQKILEAKGGSITLKKVEMTVYMSIRKKYISFIISSTLNNNNVIVSLIRGPSISSMALNHLTDMGYEC